MIGSIVFGRQLPYATGPLSYLSVTLVYCLWPNGWMDKMPLGTEVGLDPNNIVLDGDQALPHGQGHSSPLLVGPRLLWPNGHPSQQLLSSCNTIV